MRLYGLIPIITIDDAKSVRPLAQALIKAHLPVLEITFRTQAAEEALHIISEEFPEILLGAGTILTPENAEKATKAGARFLLSPGFNPRVVDYCREHSITIVPGINSPTQIELALEKNIRVLKFFPSEASGGIELIKSMAAPFPDIHFIATGGVNNSNIATYVAFPGILACGGSWIAKEKDIAAGRFEDITVTAKSAIRNMLGFKVASIQLGGIGEKDETAIEPVFSELLHQPVKKSNTTIVVSDILEFKIPGTTDLSHTICLTTNDYERALFYMQQQGYNVQDKTDEQGLRELWITEVIGNYNIKITKAGVHEQR